ncbi:MAG: RtcB family protein [Desulfovibrio sp.]|nr:RtcB family protein [Desulfovibrio sp.]
MFVVEGKRASAKVYAEDLEPSAVAQIKNLCDQEFAEGSDISLMPDAHAGAGCVVGTTMTIKDSVVPNLVGVDISCGVEAVNIGPDDFDPAELDAVIRERVPSGFAIRNKPLPISGSLNLEDLTCADQFALGKALKAIGTLGGGNHFIEVDKDDRGDYWLVIHTGSRNPGLAVANYHQKKAQASRPDAPKELAWLTGQELENYVHDMKIMQKYANTNRRAISEEIMAGMGWRERDRFTTVHNYLDTDTMILRKGSVSAQKGERLLVPINMRDGTLLCEGLGNPDWNFSSPHGAGRLMSRGEALRSLSMDEFKSQMEGIFTTSVNEKTLDEAPDAYKSMDYILKMIGETAKVVSILKPVYNFKSSAGNIRKRRKARDKEAASENNA